MLLIAALLAASGPADARTPAVLAAIGKAVHGFADDATYSIAYADLNGDKREEAIVFLIDRGWCGTGGCPVFVMTPAGKDWRKVAQTTVSRAPVYRLPARHGGWNDLGITVGGGGLEPGITAVPFRNGRYAGNPTSFKTLKVLPKGALLLLRDRDDDQVPVK
jgi:hypothetical protein